MSLNGIDISSYQADLNLSAISYDFAIIKATEGTDYVNPSCNKHVEQVQKSEKKFGLYHYASSQNAAEEADYFIQNIKGYIGKALLALDWEGSVVKRGPGWAKTWLDRVKEKTGVKPLIYMSNNLVNSYDWSSVANADYALWNAGYYAGSQPMGYQPDAPIIGSLGAWESAAIYQYTSSGRLNGWTGNLDLNVFYGDGNAWDAYAAAKKDQNSIQIPGGAANNSGLWYRAHIQTYGWLDPVHDGQTAGSTGHSLRLEALKIDLRNLIYPDIKIKARAHIENLGTVDYGYISEENIIGTTGKQLRLEAISLDVEGLPDGVDIYIRYHIQSEGWSTWIKGGEAGTYGIRKRIEAIQIKIM